jgi:hypothetical protein
LVEGIMNALRLGTLLLQKYRIDHLRVRAGDVSLYDATDVIHARHVCIKVFLSDARFDREAIAPSVIDVGRVEGAPYVVVGDSVRPAPRPRSTPPPLPARARKRPPPLPTRAAPDDLPPVLAPRFASRPPPPELTAFDEAEIARMKPRLPPLAWVAIFLVAALGAIGAGFAQAQRSDATNAHPATAPQSASDAFTL